MPPATGGVSDGADCPQGGSSLGARTYRSVLVLLLGAGLVAATPGAARADRTFTSRTSWLKWVADPVTENFDALQGGNVAANTDVPLG